MRAVIYARHSTHLQTTSSEDQIRIAKEQIKFLGYDLCGVYTDEAISGKLGAVQNALHDNSTWNLSASPNTLTESKVLTVHKSFMPSPVV